MCTEVNISRTNNTIQCLDYELYLFLFIYYILLNLCVVISTGVEQLRNLLDLRKESTAPIDKGVRECMIGIAWSNISQDLNTVAPFMIIVKNLEDQSHLTKFISPFFLPSRSV
ncbi:hypothetical protein TNCT_460741 [Trichonephila clavata]|uniref:Uncharacterized protein n=1 Tax=Trichonephila clavata TaxID=2740835 RepID=A0A8X6LR19_TRICU|nr:hypothetical protein TNCT_460741 [Trichonephila clavata]